MTAREIKRIEKAIQTLKVLAENFNHVQFEERCKLRDGKSALIQILKRTDHEYYQRIYGN